MTRIMDNQHNFQFDLSRASVFEYMTAFSLPLNWRDIGIFLDKITIGGIKDLPMDMLPALFDDLTQYINNLYTDFERES